jgi:hypothetical protein
MRKFMKVLGFLSVLATVSDVSGMADFLSMFSNEDIALNEVVSDDIVSVDVVLEDDRPAVKKARRPRRSRTVEEKPRTGTAPQPSLSPNSTLFMDIVANRELFNRFDFGRYENNTLADVLPGDKIREGGHIRCDPDVVAWASGHLLELCEPHDYDPQYNPSLTAKWEKSNGKSF